MNITQILNLVRRYVIQYPKKLRAEKGMLIKQIKTNTEASPFDMFSVYNICSTQAKEAKEILAEVDKRITATNWVVMFKKAMVMLQNNEFNLKLVEELNEYLLSQRLSNIQVCELSKICSMFPSSNFQAKLAILRATANQALQDSMSELSSYQAQIVVENINSSNANSKQFTRELSIAIQDTVLQNMHIYNKEGMFLALEIIYGRQIFRAVNTELVRRALAYRGYWRTMLAHRTTRDMELKEFISKLLGPLRMSSYRRTLRTEPLQSSDPKTRYYERARANPILANPQQSEFRALGRKIICQLGPALNTLGFQSYDQLIPMLEEYGHTLEQMSLINLLFKIFKSSNFIDFNKYPQAKTAIFALLDNLSVDMLGLNKLMHVLTAYHLEFPEFSSKLRLLDNAFQNDLQALRLVPHSSKSSLLKLVGIDISILQNMPFLTNYLLNYFENSSSQRDLSFYNKLEYLSGRTKVLPDSKFQFPKTTQSRSFLQNRVVSHLQKFPKLSVKKGAYYKGYEMDILVSHGNTKLYIDICGASHHYRNQQRLLPNIESKKKFIQRLVNYQVISPDELEHTIWKQLTHILNKHFSQQVLKGILQQIQK